MRLCCAVAKGHPNLGQSTCKQRQSRAKVIYRIRKSNRALYQPIATQFTRTAAPVRAQSGPSACPRPRVRLVGEAAHLSPQFSRRDPAGTSLCSPLPTGAPSPLVRPAQPGREICSMAAEATSGCGKSIHSQVPSNALYSNPFECIIRYMIPCHYGGDHYTFNVSIDWYFSPNAI